MQEFELFYSEIELSLILSILGSTIQFAKWWSIAKNSLQKHCNSQLKNLWYRKKKQKFEIFDSPEFAFVACMEDILDLYQQPPITAFLICVLSALRLCVCLFDNWHIRLFDID